MKANTRKILTAVLLAAAAIFLAAALWLYWAPTGEPVLESTPEPVPSHSMSPVPDTTPDPALEATVPPEPSYELPVGKLIQTRERQEYVDGSLSIYIPILEMKRTIWNGTAESTLNKGVGLYEYAQLPGEGNRNVSLAGHRNGVDKNGRITDRAPFYYVDTLREGDYLYLTGPDFIYRYLYSYTDVVTPDDWSPIYTTEESCLTITTCHPIGVSDHRMVIRAVLDEIFPYSDDFYYQASQEEVSS